MFITIIKVSVFILTIILLVSSCVTLYRWRRSAFDSTNGYLKNLRYYYPGEKVCIQAPDEPGIQYVRSDKSLQTMVYWEYCYTVDGIQYCKSYFHEDDGDKLPSKIRIYYNRKKPKIMYREGATREGIIISGFTIFLGLFFLFVLIIS